MSKGIDRILDAILEKPLDVVGLMEITQLSDSFVRNSLKYLESAGQVEKVDKRIPYVYRIPPNNPLVKNRHIIEEYKQELLDKSKDTDPIGKFVRNIPKDHWPELALNFQLMAEAIKQLESEGLLFETLDV